LLAEQPRVARHLEDRRYGLHELIHVDRDGDIALFERRRHCPHLLNGFAMGYNSIVRASVAQIGFDSPYLKAVRRSIDSLRPYSHSAVRHVRRLRRRATSKRRTLVEHSISRAKSAAPSPLSALSAPVSFVSSLPTISPVSSGRDAARKPR
jgi:hypothetical protein